MKYDTSNISDIDFSKIRYLINKDRLLKLANQMLKEAKIKLDKVDPVDYSNLEYNGGIVIGIDRIIKLIERQ